MPGCFCNKTDWSLFVSQKSTLFVPTTGGGGGGGGGGLLLPPPFVPDELFEHAKKIMISEATIIFNKILIFFID